MPSLRVPVPWLRAYVDLPIGANEVAERLHMAGMEVDHVEHSGGWGEGIWSALIESLEKHPNADKLQLATVGYGQGRRKTVVTGAFNISAGDVVPYAEIGAEIIDGHTGERTVLRPKPMRGILSEGMVLSAKELGLGDDHGGILVLDRATPVGRPLRDVLGDTTIQFEIAPNRPDALSIVGIAREASAVLGTELRHPPVEPLHWSLDPALLTVRIEDDEACPRFAAAYLKDARSGPSPDWMQARLRAAGMRPIDVIVDITNYVMLELGHPLHAYDAGTLHGRALVARLARHGETLRTLDGVDRILHPSDLVIADEGRPLGLAGIMGGEGSEISAATKEIALECAAFEPRRVRRSTAAHGLAGSSGSAAARRFGLELSPDVVPVALARAVALLREHAGATVVGAIDVYPRPRKVPNVRLHFSDVGRVLGAEIGRDETVGALRRLGFVHGEDGDQLVVTPPAFRTDVAIPEDIIEEVARIVGYDRIPVRMPTGVLPLHESHSFEAFRERARDALVGFGLQETISYALIDPAWLGRLSADGSGIAPEPLAITNPTSVAQSALRTTLRASVLDTASRNLKHRKGVAFFEISPVYLPRRGDLPDERWTIAILLAGQAEPVHEGETWLTPERDWDWHDVVGIVRGLTGALRLGNFDDQGRYEAIGLHPARSYSATHQGRTAMTAGQLDPRVAEMWELPRATFLAELDLASLFAVRRTANAILPSRFPAAWRDLAFVVAETVTWREARDEIEAAGGKTGLETVALRDVYRGPQVGDGKRSFAVRLTFRSATATLSDADVDRALGRIEGRLRHRFGATLRAP